MARARRYQGSGPLDGGDCKLHVRPKRGLHRVKGGSTRGALMENNYGPGGHVWAGGRTKASRRGLAKTAI